MVKMTADRVLVKMESLPEHYSGVDAKIIKTDIWKDTHIFGFGRVVEVGPGKWNKKEKVRLPVMAKVGDRVMFIKHHALTKTSEKLYDILGDNFIIIKDYDILAVVDEDLQLESLSQ